MLNGVGLFVTPGLWLRREGVKWVPAGSSHTLFRKHHGGGQKSPNLRDVINECSHRVQTWTHFLTTENAPCPNSSLSSKLSVNFVEVIWGDILRLKCRTNFTNFFFFFRKNETLIVIVIFKVRWVELNIWLFWCKDFVRFKYWTKKCLSKGMM